MKALFINATKFRWCSQMIANNRAQSGQCTIRHGAESMARAGIDLESSEAVYALRTQCMQWSLTPQGAVYWVLIRERDSALGN